MVKLSKYEADLAFERAELTKCKAEVEQLRTALKRLLDACDQHVGGLREGSLSDARQAARAVLRDIRDIRDIREGIE